jgi:bacterial/archaeal transporter family protein
MSGIAARRGSAIGLLTGVVLIEMLALIWFIGEVRAAFSWALVLTALCGLAAYGAFYAALRAGGASGVVVTISALYPAITVILGWLFLGNAPSGRQILGLLLALAAIWLLTAG